MIIDYISDLHIDYEPLQIKQSDIKKYFDSLGPKGEILIIAGDIDEENERLVQFLSIVKKIYGYKKIYFVLGNHELYGLKYESYYEKIQELKTILHLHEDIILLDGQVEIYNGIKIGGTMMWYDGSYMNHFERKGDLDEVWRSFMPDSTRIADMDEFDEPFKEELDKLKKIYKECDILVSHIMPLCDPKYVEKIYKKSWATSFFNFEGYKYVKGTTAKYWIFGHIHSSMNTVVEGVKMLCNPKGYKREFRNVKLKQIEI